MAPSIFRGSPNRSTRSGSFTSSRPSPRRRTSSRLLSCRPPRSARFTERGWRASSFVALNRCPARTPRVHPPPAAPPAVVLWLGLIGPCYKSADAQSPVLCRCRPHEIASYLFPRAPTSGARESFSLGAGARQSGAGIGDVRRADSVRPHCRYARQRPAPRLAGGLAGPDDAGGRGGPLRPLQHHLQHACGVARGPPVAPPVSGGAHHVLRTRAAAAAELSHRLAFRAAGEGDDHRHEYAVGALARLLPRALRQFRIAHRPAAADPVHQLALRVVIDP